MTATTSIRGGFDYFSHVMADDSAPMDLRHSADHPSSPELLPPAQVKTVCGQYIFTRHATIVEGAPTCARGCNPDKQLYGFVRSKSGNVPLWKGEETRRDESGSGWLHSATGEAVELPPEA